MHIMRVLPTFKGTPAFFCELRVTAKLLYLARNTMSTASHVAMVFRIKRYIYTSSIFMMSQPRN